MLWNVKNALSRDVEREHLNKILAEVRASIDSVNQQLLDQGSSTQGSVEEVVGRMVFGNIERGIKVTYNPSNKKLDFIVNEFTIELTGPVTGKAIVKDLGNVTIETNVDNAGFVTEAPNDNTPYWRISEQWQQVPQPLWQMETLSPAGLTVIDQDYLWRSVQLESDPTRISINNADGTQGNPFIDLAAVGNTGIGTLNVTDIDSYGRVIGYRIANTDDLIEGATNLYFTNERAQDSVGNILLDTAEIDFTYDDATPSISAQLTTSVRNSLALANSAVQSVVAGTNVSVDNTDPRNPIVSSTGGATKVPAYLTDGTYSPIPLNGDSTVPAVLADGTVSNIPVTS